MPIPRLTYEPFFSNVAAWRAMITRESLGSDMGGGLPHGEFFDRLCVRRALEDRVDVNSGRVDVVGMQPADLHELLDFRDDIGGGGRHDLVEISRGLAVLQVADHVSLPC